MLQQLYIRNFALIETCEMTFSAGLNVLSGETGAGKSILIDALGLQLGDRADAEWIRHGETRCEIQTSFTLLPTVQSWLRQNELDEENDDTCLLRRTLSKSGKSTKSQAYINGRPVPLSQLKCFGAQLVNIHGQHAHQALMHPESQLDLLDGFATTRLGENFVNAKTAVKNAYTRLNALTKKQRELASDDLNIADRVDLLTFQVSELMELNVSANEFDELVAQQKHLSAGQSLSATTKQLDDLFSEGEQPLGQLVNHALSLAQDLLQHDERAQELVALLEQASINLDEATSALGRYASKLTLDPDMLQDVETRMSELHNMARKHRIDASALPEKLASLQSALATAKKQQDELTTLDTDIVDAERVYQDAADTLTKYRQQAADELSKQIMIQLGKLSMEKAIFDVAFSSTETANKFGQDKVTFLIATNPGQRLKPLHKIASGGELSRVSLAIQVASIYQKSGITLIFDEVDAGIGGGTAEIVGQLLKTLSQYHQIICVTHLAQVAAYADNHIKIEKHSKDNSTATQFRELLEHERVEELSRMSGGINPDAATIAHAKHLLTQAADFSRSL